MLVKGATGIGLFLPSDSSLNIRAVKFLSFWPNIYMQVSYFVKVAMIQSYFPIK